jgi:orotate phosphoribosyltransferase
MIKLGMMLGSTTFMDPDRKKKLAQQIYDTCHLTGDFNLRSGRRTHEYFDKYQLAANPVMLNEITGAMTELIPRDVEVIAGLEMGAIPVVTMVSQHSGLPAAFVRKKAKEHGTARLAEGTSVSGKKVLVIEDVVTSGGQVVLSSNDLRALGAKITHALVIIDRKEGAAEALSGDGIKLISLFSREDFDQIDARP